MLNIENLDFNEMCKMLESGKFKDCYKKLLSESMFYYCAGKDVTPIVNLKDDYNLFVYADLIEYGHGDFKYETQLLYERIKKDGSVLKCIQDINLNGEFKSQLSIWENKNKFFYLLYIQGDATKIFKSLYGNGENLVLPKCICNIKYEMNTSFFLQIEKDVKYILGHSYSDNHEHIETFEYKGDYVLSGNKVLLYKKIDS